MKVRSAGMSAFSVASFAWVVALAVSTSVRSVTICCSLLVICAGVYEPPANDTCVALARCLPTPALNCCAEATTVALLCFFVAIFFSCLLSEGAHRR
jgi:hypothetical protein